MDVSVVIPCYDAAGYLARTVRSVLDQTLPPAEVIVVDDGSTDASLDVALSLRSACDRVRVVAQRSGTAAGTRNVGALAASGEALMFLDADDLVGPDTLAGLAGALGSGPAGLAICPWYRLDLVDGRWVKGPPSCAPRRPGQDPLAAWLTGWYHPPCSVMWTRDGFERAGRFEERWSSNDDGDLVMRALALGIGLAESATGSGYYRRLPGGGTLSGARLGRRGLAERLRTIRKIAALLEHDGRLSAYRAPLATACAGVAADADAGDHADQAAAARAEAARLGPPAPARAAAAAEDAVRAGVGRVRSVVSPPATSAGPDWTEEVHVGARQDGPVVPPVGRGRPETVGRPAVSVILPTYQRAHVLGRAVDSVLAQTAGDLELIVVDDGSTDGTAELVGSYDDGRIRYLRQDNAGVAAARNRGLRAVRAPLVAFLDSDDEWFPPKLALQTARMAELPDDVGLLYGGVENVTDGGCRRVRIPTHRGDLHRVLLLTNVLHGTSGVMIRRAVVATVGFFDEALPAAEDFDYWVRVARFFEIDLIDEPLVRYDDTGDAGRKTHAVEDNHAAREMFLARHGAEMRRHGVYHLFLVESARRFLERSDDAARARRAALRAARRAPASPEVRSMLARTMVREPLRRSPAARAARDRLRGLRGLRGLRR